MVAGIALLFHSQFNMKTTLTIDGIAHEYGYSSSQEVSNIGLVGDKLNFTILGGILLIAGLQIALVPEENKSNKK